MFTVNAEKINGRLINIGYVGLGRDYCIRRALCPCLLFLNKIFFDFNSVL